MDADGKSRKGYLLFQRTPAEEEDDKPKAGVEGCVGCILNRLEAKAALGSDSAGVETLVVEDQQGGNGGRENVGGL